MDRPSRPLLQGSKSTSVSMRQRAVEEDEPATQDDQSMMTTVKRQLPKMDMFPKLSEDYVQKTTSGGVVSIITYALMAILFLSEASTFVSTVVDEHIRVDNSLGEKLRINVNVTYFALNCAEVEVVAMDVLGQHQMDAVSTHKHRLHANGSELGGRFLAPKPEDKLPPLPKDYCGSCFGAQDSSGSPKCCNTCAELRTAYATKGWGSQDLDRTAEQCIRENKDPAKASQKGEGCNLEGFLEVTKVSGNFHVALGKSKSVDGRLIHEFNPSEAQTFNTSHHINHLSFGAFYPGQINPLDRKLVVHDGVDFATGVSQYFIKVVPTVYKDS